jgi:phosphate-selective porin OprO/OprP
MGIRSKFALLALSLLLGVFPVTAVAQADDEVGNVEIAILDVLLERGIIDQAQYEEMLALARAKVEDSRTEIDLIEGRLARLRAPEVQMSGGSPGKLEFTSADGKWSAKFKGRIQARVTDLDSDDNDEDGTNFSVPRARFGVSGRAGGEHIKYKFEIDAPTDKELGSWDDSDGNDAEIKDAYIDYGMSDSTALKMGHFKFPFGREELTSSGNISLMERSIATDVFAPGRDPGFMYHGGADDGAFEYYLAIANGDGENEPNSAAGSGPVLGEEYDGLRYGARVVFHPMGPMKLDGPAFQTLEDDGVKMAFGASFMMNEDDDGLAPVKADADTLGLEFQLMSGPLSLLAEWFSRTAELSAPGTDVDDDGFTVQAGMFLEPNVWELVARYSEVDFDADSPFNDLEEVTIGINRYVAGHAGKWMLDLVELDVDSGTPDEQQLRLQYQLIF